MGRDFRVINADIKDFDAAFALLERRALHPDEKRWRRFCDTLSCSETKVDTLNQAMPFTVVDKIGMPRGFFILRRRSHLLYPRLLDMPLAAVEHGPNENHIARAIFDYVIDFAGHRQFDAVHFGRASKVCEQQLASDAGARLDGTIMPLCSRPQRQSDPSKSSTMAKPLYRSRLGRPFDQSLLSIRDASRSQRWRLTQLA